MFAKEIRSMITGILRFFNAFLPTLFWSLIIFGFEEPTSAASTMLCAFIHEGGHISYLLFRGNGAHKTRGVLSGMRIRTDGLVSYNKKIMTYLCGPLANLIAFFIFIFLAPIGDFFQLMAVMNIVTMLSNLLPIEGYDGYGIICSLIEKNEATGYGLRILSGVSTSLIFVFCILSLYLIDRHGGGYWIFAVFFFSMIKHFSKTLKE